MLIDSHCHLDFEAFDEDRDEVVSRAAAAGVARIIVPAVHLDNAPAVLGLAERYEGVFAAIGVHPNSSAGWQDGWVDSLRELAGHEKVVAIGEIGLDYYWDRSPKEVQHQALAAQLALAAELALPVIIHNRDASADVIRVLSKSAPAGRERPGVLHSFSADWETAQRALQMGYYLGFTGPITYKKADDLRHVAAQVPLERLLVETDAPFLAPQPYRGRRNEPAYVAEVADRLAALHNVATARLARQSTENVIRLFGEQLR